MSWEITKVVNGYLVHRARSERDYSVAFDEVYVFQDYNKLVDKLKELLDQPRRELK